MIAKRLVFQKFSARNLQAEKVQENIDYLRSRAVYGARTTKGWKCNVGAVEHTELETPVVVTVQVKDPENKENLIEKQKELSHVYKFSLDIVYIPKRSRKPEILEREWDGILRVLTTLGNTKGWELVENVELDPSYTFTTTTEQPSVVDNTVVETSEVTDTTEDLNTVKDADTVDDSNDNTTSDEVFAEQGVTV